jgi:Gly-Xaa carboxypeptidase
MSKSLRKAVFDLEDSLTSKKGKVDKKALEKVLDWWVEGSVKEGVLPPGLGKAMVSTTQAVDIINGGVKVNALVRAVLHISLHFSLPDRIELS